MKSGSVRHRGFLSHLWHAVNRSGVLIPVVFITLAARFAPITYSGEFDPDEGVNLMKALLVSRGYALYSDIWSDQAPLATIILGQWIRWFGTSVVASRILVLLFSALLLWAFYQTIRLALSELAALVGATLLVLSAWYARLSISVMIGLPALALAVLSIYLLLLAQERRRLWLIIASAAVLAASLQTKLFTAILVPVLLAYILLPIRGPAAPIRSLRQGLGRGAAWLGAFLAVFAIMGLVFGSLDPRQLLAPHLGEATRTAFLRGDNLAFIGSAFLRHIACVPLAIIGLAWAIRNRTTVVFLPLGWLVASLAFLLYERPLWYHHVLVLTIPLVWLSAFGVEAGRRAVRGPVRATSNEWKERASQPSNLPSRGVAIGALALFGAAIALFAVFNPATRKPLLHEEIPGRIPEYDAQVVDWLCPGGRSKEAWLFTDRPIYAFQAGLAVPPPVAVLTLKRLSSGMIDEADLLDVIRTYRPEYILLERYLPDYSHGFLTEVRGLYDLAREYSLGLEDLPGQLLLRHPPDASGAAGTEGANALFGDWLSLEWQPGSSSGDSEAGDCLQVRDLQWTRPEVYTAPNLALSIRLVDQLGEVWVQHDEQLGNDKNTLRDRAQLPYFVNLFVPEGTPPGSYNTELIVYDPMSGQPLPVTAAGTAAPPEVAAVDGNRLVLGEAHIARPSQEPTLRRPLADFGPLRLVEAETPATQVSPADSVPLSLLWQARSDFRGESLVVVAQLLDKEGRVVAGLEEQPLQGRYPTTGWQPRELVRDRHRLTLPEGTPPGEYKLIVGLYTLPDRARLKTKAGFLGLTPLDYFPLRSIQVVTPTS